MVRLLAAALVLALFAGAARAEDYADPVAPSLEHRHGEDGIPDWYESNCCNKRDCHPVPDDTITFTTNEIGEPLVAYRPHGSDVTLFYGKTSWRTSLDDRLHACHQNMNALCVYLRPGA